MKKREVIVYSNEYEREVAKLRKRNTCRTQSILILMDTKFISSRFHCPMQIDDHPCIPGS